MRPLPLCCTDPAPGTPRPPHDVREQPRLPQHPQVIPRRPLGQRGTPYQVLDPRSSGARHHFDEAYGLSVEKDFVDQVIGDVVVLSLRKVQGEVEVAE